MHKQHKQNEKYSILAHLFQAAKSLCQILFFDHFWYSGIFNYGELESDGIINF